MLNELKKQTKILEETLKWVKFSGMKDVKEVLLDNLTDETKILIYYYSNGVNAIPFIKNLLGIGGNNVIPNLWNKWKNLGIMEKVPARGGERGKKIFDLEDFGIPIPEVKQKKMKGNIVPKTTEQETETLESEEPKEEKGDISENGQEL